MKVSANNGTHNHKIFNVYRDKINLRLQKQGVLSNPPVHVQACLPVFYPTKNYAFNVVRV